MGGRASSRPTFMLECDCVDMMGGGRAGVFGTTASSLSQQSASPCPSLPLPASSLRLPASPCPSLPLPSLSMPDTALHPLTVTAGLALYPSTMLCLTLPHHHAVPSSNVLTSSSPPAPHLPLSDTLSTTVHVPRSRPDHFPSSTPQLSACLGVAFLLCHVPYTTPPFSRDRKSVV